MFSSGFLSRVRGCQPSRSDERPQPCMAEQISREVGRRSEEGDEGFCLRFYQLRHLGIADGAVAMNPGLSIFGVYPGRTPDLAIGFAPETVPLNSCTRVENPPQNPIKHSHCWLLSLPSPAEIELRSSLALILGARWHGGKFYGETTYETHADEDDVRQ
jgi:hypothetical protein